MIDRIDLERLLYLLNGDRSLLTQLCEAGLLPEELEEFLPEHAETARIAGTLVHELEVNWAGVEVVLRLRSNLVATQRQIADLLALLQERSAQGK